MVETHRLGVERRERANRLLGQPGRARQFVGRRHAAELFLEQRGGLAQTRQVGGPVERHPHRTAMPGDRRLHRLANPPHRVRNELDAAIRIELPGRRHQAEVALADQVDQRHATILELLRHRHHETDVVPRQPLLGEDVALERPPGERHLFLTVEQRDARDLVQIQIQTFAALVHRPGDLRRTERPPLPANSNGHVQTPIPRSRSPAIGPEPLRLTSIVPTIARPKITSESTSCKYNCNIM